VVDGYGDAKTVSNWITGEIFRLLKSQERTIEESRLTAGGLLELLTLIDKGTINPGKAKEILAVMFDSGADPQAIVEERGLSQISDQSELDRLVSEIVEANPRAVADYRAGKKSAVGFLMGQVMKSTGGKANPNVVRDLLTGRLDESD
jgi:aspartyl-tRNA(Asn)/glutamyl-tRNA(Gln) amidotransferase subunit B